MSDPTDPPARGPGYPKGKPRLTKTMASYQALVDAFRQAPGNYSQAAVIAGCHRSAAKVAWEKGWHKLGLPGAGPIREVIESDRVKARIAAAEAARKERDLADAELAKKRAEAMKALEDEASLMNSNRRGLLSLSQTVEKMIGILPLYAFQIQKAVAQDDPHNPGKLIPIPNPAVSVELAVAVISSVGLSAQRVAYATSRLVELSRLERGQSTVNVAEADLTEPVEVLEEIRAAATLFDRLQAAKDEADAEAVEPGPTLQ
jgi:hypothetical protein